MKADADPKFTVLLDFLKRSRGFDFSGYKRASLMRRILRRMQAVNVGDFADCLDYLEVHPEEFAQLFNTILINVTAFFRDEPVWEFLRTNVLPDLLSDKRQDNPIRVWSAGCASGEEPRDSLRAVGPPPMAAQDGGLSRRTRHSAARLRGDQSGRRPCQISYSPERSSRYASASRNYASPPF